MNDSQKTPRPKSARATNSSALPENSGYPFSALVGQEEMKLALILNVIDWKVGGALIMGHRGTAKSTAVRALADLLPEINVVVGCAYRCDPAGAQEQCAGCREKIAAGARLRGEKMAVRVVELPLGATEDRVCGTIDIEHALRGGGKQFESGLLARANRGFLYLDEANLLEDHLVDLLLDVSSSGINYVEREGISVRHPARFVLIGSGNPEEGELRPQLLDRFGLYVEVKTEAELNRRVEIIERREAFERDHESFRLRFLGEQDQLRRQIVAARKNLAKVKVERKVVTDIARLCSELKTDGHRGELTIIRAARALAVFSGRKKVTETDVRQVAVMALRHRLRRDAWEETASAERIEDALDDVFANGALAGRETGNGGGSSEGRPNDLKQSEPHKKQGTTNGPPAGKNGNARPNRGASSQGNAGSDASESRSRPTSSATGKSQQTFGLEKSSLKRLKGPSAMSESSRGRAASGANYNHDRGTYARSIALNKGGGRVALDATLRAAAASARPKALPVGELRIELTPADLRFKLFKRKQGRLFIFAIDLSGSMALNRISYARELILGLLRESYILRDRVAIVGFRGQRAEIMLPPSKSILRARRVLEQLPVGGATPLSAGLALSLEVAQQDTRAGEEKVLLIFTDGGANMPLSADPGTDRSLRKQIIHRELVRLREQFRKAGLAAVLVDPQKTFRTEAETRYLAETLGARFVKL